MVQPYYTIDFSAAACMFEIRVNDYPVLTLNIEGQVAINIPINFAILDKGKQTISAVVLPILGETILNPNAALHFTSQKEKQHLKLFNFFT